MNKWFEVIGIIVAVIGVIIALLAWLAPFSPIGRSPLPLQATDSLCPFQSETDWGTIKNIFNAEGKAVVEEDMDVIRQIYAPNANIREARSALGGNQVITQFQEFFAERDFQKWEHYGLKLVDNTGQVAWVTGGVIGRSIYVASGQVEEIQTDPEYDHWTLGKNENGC